MVTTTRLRVGAAALAAAAAGTAAPSGGAAPDRSSPAVPVWSASWLQANPGEPLVLHLDAGKATICFVGLRGPGGAHPVGWRFQPGGRRLSLTLLTHADAVGGEWLLRASCHRSGDRARSAGVVIAVPAPGGAGPLATHGDMRVQALPAT